MACYGIVGINFRAQSEVLGASSNAAKRLKVSFHLLQSLRQQHDTRERGGSGRRVHTSCDSSK